MLKAGSLAGVLMVVLSGCLERPRRPLTSGVQLTYQLDLDLAEDPGPEVLRGVKTIVGERLDLYGVREFFVETKEPDRLVVQVPGSAESVEKSRLRPLVENGGRLEFLLVASEDLQTEDRIREIVDEERKYDSVYRAWIQRKQEFLRQARAKKEEPPQFAEPHPTKPEYLARPQVELEAIPGKAGQVRLLEVKNRWGHLLTVLHNGDQYKIDGAFLSSAAETYDENGRPAVAFGFRTEGATKLANLTGPNVGRTLAIVLDGKVRQVARISSRIYDRAQLTGNFSRDEVRGIVAVLRGGSLPVTLKLLSQDPIPTAGGR